MKMKDIDQFAEEKKIKAKKGMAKTLGLFVYLVIYGMMIYFLCLVPYKAGDIDGYALISLCVYMSSIFVVFSFREIIIGD